MLKPENDMRVNAFGLALAFAVIVSGFILATQWRTGSPAPIILCESINPNTAPVGSLLRLPGIGPIRARAIVAYRQVHGVDYPKQMPFRCLDDLECIKGLGPKTVSALSPWLKFDNPM